MSIMCVSHGFLESKLWSLEHVPVMIFNVGISGQQGNILEGQVGWIRTLSLNVEDVIQEYLWLVPWLLKETVPSHRHFMALNQAYILGSAEWKSWEKLFIPHFISGFTSGYVGSRGHSQSQMGETGMVDTQDSELIVADALLLHVVALLTFSGSREIFPMSWFLITIQEAYL